MSWKRRYHIRSYLGSSLWVVPIAAIVLEYFISDAVRAIDNSRFGWKLVAFGIEGARAIMDATITLSLSFIVFTFLFAVKTLDRTEGRVPELAGFCTGIFALLCIVAFLFLIDYAARLLRPVSLVQRIGQSGITVLVAVYPEKLMDGEPPHTKPPELGPVSRVLGHRGHSAIVVAVNLEQLIAAAEKAGGVIEFVPQVGDFVGTEEPLFILHGAATSIQDQALRDCIIFGSERTVEQDPLFALRILVDIALKALSAAINDPTTAVLAIDQIHRLLRTAGGRSLRTDFIYNRKGDLRVIFRTPDWEDFVQLAFTEIRCCGASNVQIARRLRAMIVNLANTIPVARHAALRRELGLLDRMLEKRYDLPEDLALARVPDSQGLGVAATEATLPWGA